MGLLFFGVSSSDISSKSLVKLKSSVALAKSSVIIDSEGLMDSECEEKNFNFREVGVLFVVSMLLPANAKVDVSNPVTSSGRKNFSNVLGGDGGL